MNNKPITDNNNTRPVLTLIAFVVTGVLGAGLAGCEKKSESANLPMRMEEPINNAQEATSDAWITTKVKTELLADSLSKGFDIEVNTVEGVVSLNGKVKDADAITHVHQIAHGVKGVTDVNTSGLMIEEAKGY